MHIQPCGGSTSARDAKLGKVLRADSERDVSSESIKPTNDRVEVRKAKATKKMVMDRRV